MIILKKIRQIVSSPWWKWILTFIVLFFFGRFIQEHRLEALALPQVIQRLPLLYLVSSFLLGLAFITTQSLFLRSSFRIIGKNPPFSASVYLFLKRYFLASFLPEGLTVSQYTFVEEFKPYGVSKVENYFASTLYLVISGVGYLVILFPTIIYLLVSGELTFLTFSAALVTLLVTILGGVVLYQLFQQRGQFYRWAQELIPDLTSTMETLRNRSLNKVEMVKATTYSIAIRFVEIILLLVIFAALQLPVSFTATLVSYVLVVLVVTVSPTPRFGLTEITLTFGLDRFGLTSEAAFSATQIFRLFELWLPVTGGLLLIGFSKFRVRYFGETEN